MDTHLERLSGGPSSDGDVFVEAANRPREFSLLAPQNMTRASSECIPELASVEENTAGNHG
jgi:hypothetical protein